MTAPDPQLVALLVCPVTRSSLRFDLERQALVAARGGMAWPVVDGVPQLLPDARHAAAAAPVSRARP
jgi:uncharacterized protein YbaR (Trm112 family)